MISSKVIDVMMPLFDIIKQSKGKTIGEIKQELNIEREKMKKGASGLIVENLLGIKNNNIADADIPEIGCEVKILPLQKCIVSNYTYMGSLQLSQRSQMFFSVCLFFFHFM